MSPDNHTPGRRGEDGGWTSERQPGEYWHDGNRWCGITPDCAQQPGGHYVDLTTWQITEHEDGTITVAPSIFVNKDRPNAWHGFLEHGEWREV